MEKRITYYLGAGASANALPIWKSQAEAMIELGEFLLIVPFESEQRNPFNRNLNFRKWIGYEMTQTGLKARDFNTVDAYAKKLFLNNLEDELNNLKLVVSTFFTLFQFADDIPEQIFKGCKENIDHRYMALLAALLEKNKEGGLPIIPSNFSFITWNYDLQFELAYMSFCPEGTSWRDISSHFGFTNLKGEDLKICHLNGFHGHYSSSDGTKHIKLQIGNCDSILERIIRAEETDDPIHHINYAWEKNAVANVHRNKAKEIIKKTDLLIIIGYSFPPFNRMIDHEILSGLEPSSNFKNVIYQDKNPTNEILANYINPEIAKRANLISDKLDYFEIPFDQNV